MQKIYLVQTEIITQDTDQNIILLNGYRPQNGKLKGTKGCPIEEILLHIETLKKLYPKHRFIHGMDLNGHNDQWMNKPIKNKYSKASKTGTTYANWLNENGWLILNNGASTRIVITEKKYEKTTPDTTAIDSNCNRDDFYWWTENYGPISDHILIITLIDDGQDYKQLMDEAYTLRTGDERNWNKLKQEIKKKNIKNFQIRHKIKLIKHKEKHKKKVNHYNQ
eukprot:118509_1